MTTYEKNPRVAIICPYCKKAIFTRLNDITFEREVKE